MNATEPDGPTRAAVWDGVKPSAPVIVKLGGRALEAPGAIGELARDLDALAGGAVLVHGGGAAVSEWCGRLAIEPRFVRGRRVTDAATLEVAVAVLAGLANKRLVASLRAAGIDAVGLAALDGGLADARPHREAGELGAVGEIRGLDPALLRLLIGAGHVPVLASIAACGDRLLNVNADDLAGAVAAGLGARALVLLSDVPGVRLGGRFAARLDRTGLDAALASPEVTGGMAPKLAAARAALAAGVSRVWIAGWNGPGTLAALFEGRGVGTLIDPGVGKRGLSPAEIGGPHG